MLDSFEGLELGTTVKLVSTFRIQHLPHLRTLILCSLRGRILESSGGEKVSSLRESVQSAATHPNPGPIDAVEGYIYSYTIMA